MAEKYKFNPENSNEDLSHLSEKLRQNDAEKLKLNHEEHNNKGEKLKDLTEKAHAEAAKAEDINKRHLKHDQNHDKAHAHHASDGFASYSAKQTLNRVRKHLKPAERNFSKVLHNQTVDTVSNVAGATVARPSGLMWGGVFSLLSSLILYIMARHYGFEYSFFVGIIFFVGGFALGLLLEVLSKIFRKKPKRY